MPDPVAIERQKAAYHTSLEEQMSKAEEMLAKQQKEQAEYIFRAAEVQKKQILSQIDQQAKEQELMLNQKYSEQLTVLQQQCMRQKIQLEKQATELSNSFNMRKMQEELMEQQYQRQRVVYDEQMKQTEEVSRQQRNQRLQLQPERWQYNPHLQVPVDIRAEPDINGQRTDSSLRPGELFLVCEEQEGPDSIIYLRLADGRGWLFDRKPDTGIMCIRQGGSMTVSSQAPPSLPGLPFGAVPPHLSVAAQPLNSGSPLAPAPVLPPLPPLSVPDVSSAQLALTPSAQPRSPTDGVPMPCAVAQTQQAAPAAVPLPSHWLYAPDITALMDIRAVPDINGPRTSHILQPGELLIISEEREGEDGVLYLRLADGRGWAMEGMPAVGSLCVRHEGEEAGDSKAQPAAAPRAAPAAGEASGKGFSAGLRVRTVRLLSRPEMNSKAGVLRGFDTGKGRWKVTLEDGSGTKLLREENLEPLDTAAAPVATEGSEEAQDAKGAAAAQAEVPPKPDPPKAVVCTCGNHLVPHATFCGRCGTMRDALLDPALADGAAGAEAVQKQVETRDEYNRRIEDMLVSGEIEWEDW